MPTHSYPSSHRQQGFTLVELVMVIIVLGILSAVALPRFVDFGSRANEAKMENLGGTMKVAAESFALHMQTLGINLAGQVSGVDYNRGTGLYSWEGYSNTAWQNWQHLIDVDATITSVLDGTDAGLSTVCPKSTTTEYCAISQAVWPTDPNENTQLILYPPGYDATTNAKGGCYVEYKLLKRGTDGYEINVVTDNC